MSSPKKVHSLRRRTGRDRDTAKAGRLTASPRQRPVGEPVIGLQPLDLGNGRDGMIYVPSGYRGDRPAPLVLMLHGAGGNAQHGLAPFLPLADGRGAILVAPESRGETWDFIVRGFGEDVEYIDETLETVFERYAIDPARIALEGFSDGASYALSLGIANGDLFTHIIAFSPGFVAAPGREGAPRILITHGEQDRVLPIDRCSRTLVPRLQSLGHNLRYLEFPDGHNVPLSLAGQAMDWFVSDKAP